MTQSKPKKKWSRTEWLLLLAPLLVIGGLAILNLAPQVQQDYRERRDYGSQQPYAVFYPRDTKGTGDLALYHIAFSPDGKYIATSEFGTSKDTVGNHGVEVWDVASRRQVSSWPVAGKRTFVNVLKFVSPKVLDVGLWTGGTQNPQKTGERRDARNGKLLSGQKVHMSPEVPPSALYSASAFNRYSKPRPEKLGDTKLSIKLFTVKMPIKVDSSFLPAQYQTFVVQWMAQVYDAQGRKLRRPFALLKYFDFSTSAGTSVSSLSFCSSPDGKTLIIQSRTTDFLAKGISQNMDEWLEAFDTKTGRSLWKRFLMQHKRQNGLFRAIAFSPNSAVTALLIDKTPRAISKNGNVELRNTRTGATLRQFDVRPFTKNYMISLYMQFSSDGKLLAVPQDDRLELWDVSDVH